MKNKKRLSLFLSFTIAVVAGLSIMLAIFVKPTKAEPVKNASSTNVNYDYDGVYKVTKSSTAAQSPDIEKGGYIYVGPGSTYVMNGGSINGNYNTFGGAVFVADGGSFTMNAGTIANCESYQGGAIYVADGGECTINGGTISNCYAEFGGAVYVENGGKLKLNDGAIDSCYATKSNAGVSYYKNTNAVVEKNNSFEIKNCAADDSFKYETIINYYVDGALSKRITQKTRIVKNSFLDLKNDQSCGLFSNMSQTQSVEEFQKIYPQQEIELFTRKSTSGLIYTLNDDGESYSVSSNNALSGEVVIQREYEGKPVTNIINLGTTKEEITRVFLPKTISVINENAFDSYTSLKEINVSQNINKIGNYAFNDCL